MPFSIFKTTLPLLVLLLGSSFAQADEVDELRERAEAMQREARELFEAGRGEEAERVEREAIGMLEEAEKLSHRQRGGRDKRATEIRDLQAHLHQLLREQANVLREQGENDRVAELREEMRRVEGRLHELAQAHARPPQARPPHHRPGSHPDVQRRLEHLRAAVEHLHQAGLHDVAERVAEQAHAAERELAPRRPERPAPEAPLREMMKQMERLHDVVERLHGDVRRLEERLDRRPRDRDDWEEVDDDDDDDDDDA